MELQKAKDALNEVENAQNEAVDRLQTSSHIFLNQKQDLDPDPNQNDKSDLTPHQVERSDCDSDPYESEKSDPDQHQIDADPQHCLEK